MAESKVCCNLDSLLDEMTVEEIKALQKADFKGSNQTIELQKVFEIIKECEKHFSHICKTKKEMHEETCRYEGVIYFKSKLKEYIEELE